MKKILVLIFIVLISCSDKLDKNQMDVHVTLNGLQKGRVLLKKWKDSTFVNVDYKDINGDKTIVLSDIIESPEMYYLVLDKTNKELPFFGEQGNLYINAKLKSVNYKNDIKGSKNDSVYRIYRSTFSKFNGSRLDLIEAKFKERNNELKLDSVQNQIDNLDKRQLRYALNFVFTHGEYEVAPYIALTDLTNLTTRYLDTLELNFSDKVKASKYGKGFSKFIEERKQQKN